MKRILFTFVTFLVFVCSAHAETKNLHIALGSGYPPFYFFDANQLPTGICIDIVDQVAHSMDITVHYEIYPWKRMLNYGKEGKVDAVMPLFKTSEREQFLFFPATGLVEEDNSFFTASSNPINFSGNLADVIDHKISVIDKYSYGEEFDNTHFTNKTSTQNTEQIIKQVLNKRIDLGIGNPKVVTYVAKQMDVVDKIRFLSPPVTSKQLFIGFSKKKVDQEFINRFNEQLKKLKASKAYIDIIQAYVF